MRYFRATRQAIQRTSSTKIIGKRLVPPHVTPSALAVHLNFKQPRLHSIQHIDIEVRIPNHVDVFEYFSGVSLEHHLFSSEPL
jgi:hypothetical protein